VSPKGEGSPAGGDGSGIVRRRLLQLLGAGAAAIGLSGSATGQEKGGRGGGRGRGGSDNGSTLRTRLKDEFNRRKRNAQRQFRRSDASVHGSNDRITVDAVVAKFGKSLPHDDGTGLPTTGAYDDLVAATETGGEEVAYEAIPQADSQVDSEVRPLVQPESAWTYQAEGASIAGLRIAVPPAFDDPETGAEMVELYWRALTRDVNFRDYGVNELVAAAADELDDLDAYNGPGADSEVTPGNVFRGVTPGNETGPYVSQFLWKDRDLGGGVEDQKIEVQAEGSDYVTDVDEWLAVQRGEVPSKNEFGEERYIITGRDMCERVHDDPPFRQVQKAAQVLVFTMNAPLDEGIPYTLKPFGSEKSRRDKETFLAQTTLPFNDFGPLYIEKKVLEATEHGQKAAWHKKWNVHRRLRPEEYGGRVQAALGEGLAAPEGVDYTDLIPDTLLDSEALARTKGRFGSYLLPQSYAEGSPTHPSYPAGHSVVAGAGVTVLKAFFDGDYEFPAAEKVIPMRDGSELETAAETDAMGIDETLTVRGELNKLASNMALGRNRAGIHYRTDGIEGLRLGERAAIRFLQDQLTLPSRVDEVTLSLETFDGDAVTVEPTG
jgi:hypothetical protein